MKLARNIKKEVRIYATEGFHACENPIDVLSYYPPASSRYCEVLLGAITGQTSSDSKSAGECIKIGAEIGIKGIVDASVKFTFGKVDWENAKESNTGDKCSHQHRIRKCSHQHRRPK